MMPLGDEPASAKRPEQRQARAPSGTPGAARLGPHGPGLARRRADAVLSAGQRAEEWVAAEAEETPSWLRATRGETRWPALAAVLVAVAVQFALPERLSVGPRWVLPAVEVALAAGLLVANPVRMGRDSPLIRRASLLLVAAISVGNGASAILLVRALLHGPFPGGAATLLANGAGVYVTNIVAFALWYWELDRGGPIARAAGRHANPDFLFPQMTLPTLTPSDWRPVFADYLYLSYTNTTAFSPTDTMPMSRWAKMLMLVQSAIALITAALVIARAVNIFQ